MELVEDLGAKINKCSSINVYIKIFCNISQDHSLTFSLNIFYFQNCTLQHINNTITQRNRIGTKAYSLYSSSPEHV